MSAEGPACCPKTKASNIKSSNALVPKISSDRSFIRVFKGIRDDLSNGSRLSTSPFPALLMLIQYPQNRQINCGKLRSNTPVATSSDQPFALTPLFLPAFLCLSTASCCFASLKSFLFCASSSLFFLFSLFSIALTVRLCKLNNFLALRL